MMINQKSSELLVSVGMIAFNHEKYIRAAIEGVLLQKTNFPIELVIGEDNSLDNTQVICSDYAEKHPDLIRLLQSVSNIGMIPNFIRTLKECKGKYIAICEGDDYWTDPYKLQKQVEFMETNSDCGLVHTDLDIYYQDSNLFERQYHLNHSTVCQGDLFEKLLVNNSIATVTVMFKSDYLKTINFDQMSNFKIGDLFLWLEIAKHSKIGFIKESTAVYRVHYSSASNHFGGDRRSDFISSAYNISYYFMETYGCSIETEEEVLRKALDTWYSINNRKLFNEAYTRLGGLSGIKISDKMKYRFMNLPGLYHLHLAFRRISHYFRQKSYVR